MTKIKSNKLILSPAVLNFTSTERMSVSEIVLFQSFLSLGRSFRFKIFFFFLLQESIAYFPLVILISGVFSSLGAKKLDKMLGAKVRRKG